MSNFSYKKTETTVLKVTGYLNPDTMTIEVNGEQKELRTLLKDFTGACVELNVKVKEEEELDEPTSDENDEDE